MTRQEWLMVMTPEIMAPKAMPPERAALYVLVGCELAEVK
jgi:hypothetical protein